MTIVSLLPRIGFYCVVLYFLLFHLDLITDHSVSTKFHDSIHMGSQLLIALDQTITPSIPLWPQATLPERLLIPATSLWLPLLKGGWWTFFRWIYATSMFPLYYFLAFI